MPNLTYWLFGGYIAWLLVSGKYKGMLSLATTSSWSTAQANAALSKTAQSNLAASNGMYSGGGLGVGPGGYKP